MQYKIPFVLAASDDGPMIVNFLDFAYTNEEKTQATGVGFEVLRNGAHAKKEIDIIFGLICHQRRLRGDGVVVLDCGANIGTYTMPLAKAMQDWGEITAIEPQEYVFYALAGTIVLNNLFNAHAIWSAVSDKAGKVRLPKMNYRIPANYGGISVDECNKDREVGLGQALTGETVDVPCTTIDALNLPRLDVLKLDVESMEVQVLAGGKETISRCRPAIVAEMLYTSAEAIAEQLPGYRVVRFGIDGLAIPEDDPLWQVIKLREV